MLHHELGDRKTSAPSVLAGSHNEGDSVVSLLRRQVDAKFSFIGRGSCALVLALAVLSGCSAPSGQTTGDIQFTPTASSTQPSGWQQYADPNGDSSVDAYEIGSDYVQVRFTDGSVYLYTYASAGESNIERMKELAQSGNGLNSFIMNNVKYDYASKQR